MARGYNISALACYIAFQTIVDNELGFWLWRSWISCQENLQEFFGGRCRECVFMHLLSPFVLASVPLPLIRGIRYMSWILRICECSNGTLLSVWFKWKRKLDHTFKIFLDFNNWHSQDIISMKGIRWTYNLFSMDFIPSYLLASNTENF